MCVGVKLKWMREPVSVSGWRHWWRVSCSWTFPVKGKGAGETQGRPGDI